VNTADDLARQAHVLAEKLQRARQGGRGTKTVPPGEVAAMESRLSALWGAIRAARVSDPPRGAPERRTRPKWE